MEIVKPFCYTLNMKVGLYRPQTMVYKIKDLAALLRRVAGC